MAQRLITQLVDDLDGAELAEGAGETMRFLVDGTSYDIDLSSANADKLRQALAPYIASARKATGRGARARSGPSDTRRDPAQTQHIREWARAEGHQVSDRGRIPAAVIDAYEAEH
jgi:hypothetical protein